MSRKHSQHQQSRLSTENLLNQTIYNPISQLPLNQKFWWEAFGMFFLILLICQIKPFYGFDLWISSILPVAIMLSVKQSGAHYNPSMSMSNFFIKFSPSKFSPIFMWTYFKAQFVPAFIAYNITFYMRGYYYPPPIPNQKLTGYQILISEMIGTFMLVVFLQKIANSQTTFTTSDIETYSFVVVFVYIARKYAVLSGNSINPVATFAGVCALVFQCEFQFLQYFYLYLIGDFLGACAGTWFYNHMLEPAIRISRKQKAQQQKPQKLQKKQSQNSITEQIIRQIEQEQKKQILKLTRIEHRSGIESDEEFDILKDVRFPSDLQSSPNSNRKFNKSDHFYH